MTPCIPSGLRGLVPASHLPHLLASRSPITMGDRCQSHSSPTDDTRVVWKLLKSRGLFLCGNVRSVRVLASYRCSLLRAEEEQDGKRQ